ncbi:MAG TPA: CopG family ribbon-helix-helix protein [Thermoplasmatales archaeon]|nr:CopG family ribbon-helix-helix protein [Candidatus Thermoplasmatota archaeon]HDS59858.1 CopG family ribbon-helix-helix protein [Thermoplasmatales archaeon]
MTGARKSVGIISVSVPDSLLRDIGRVMAEAGYTSRSELVRDALRAFLKNRTHLEGRQGTVQGVITLLYHHASAGRVSAVRHRYMHLFRSFMHADFDMSGCSCCEVLLFSGEAAAVRQACNELQSVRGVEESHVYIASP